jgi:hypothetical protein
MSPVGFEPTIPASARPQTYALDRAVAGIGHNNSTIYFLHMRHDLIAFTRKRPSNAQMLQFWYRASIPQLKHFDSRSRSHSPVSSNLSQFLLCLESVMSLSSPFHRHTALPFHNPQSFRQQILSSEFFVIIHWINKWHCNGIRRLLPLKPQTTIYVLTLSTNRYIQVLHVPKRSTAHFIKIVNMEQKFHSHFDT